MIQARFSALLRSQALLLAFVLAAIAVGGCNSNRVDPRDAIKQERPVAMKGESDFLGGDVVASITVGRGFQHENSLGKRGFRQTEAEQIMEQIGELNSEDKNYYKDIAKILNLEVRGSHMAPLSAQLRLTNRTKREITVEIPEFNSALGNFAVQPGTVKLAAEETVVLEPMSSQLGFGGDLLPVKMTLKADGKTDAHIVDVKSVIVQAKK